MADTHETVADIIAEMRFHGQLNIDAEKDKPEFGVLTVEGRSIQSYADRLEAALRREKAEWINANAGLAKLVDIEKVGDCAKLREDLASPECQVKPLSLDEAISHADEVAGDCSTACKREHKQLADWLRELKNRRNGSGDAAKLREAMTTIQKLIKLHGDNEPQFALTLIAEAVCAALAAPPRNCDVGVPEERIQRWSKFCKARSKKLPPIHGFEWEDYPYESEVKEGANDGNE